MPEKKMKNIKRELIEQKLNLVVETSAVRKMKMN